MGKRLSEEATLLIRENVEVVLKEKLNILDEELPKIVTKHLLILNKEKEKEKLHTVEKILKNYIPLQKQIKNVENLWNYYDNDNSFFHAIYVTYS